MKVADILQAKGNIIYSVTGSTTVYEAIKVMGEKNIGALLVLEGGKLTGILSERDYARKVVLKGKASRETSVSDIMTADVITVMPSDTIETCMELMTQKHIRHLPVLDGDGQVIGVVSIGDLVKETISQQQFVIKQLEHYIAG